MSANPSPQWEPEAVTKFVTGIEVFGGPVKPWLFRVTFQRRGFKAVSFDVKAYDGHSAIIYAAPLFAAMLNEGRFDRDVV